MKATNPNPTNHFRKLPTSLARCPVPAGPNNPNPRLLLILTTLRLSTPVPRLGSGAHSNFCDDALVFSVSYPSFDGPQKLSSESVGERD